jgi:medium-chain acyl-[acyl-carrier-protein] hydrolase
MIRPPPAHPMSRYQSPWALRFGQPGATPRMRLFCFPYAGGDANLYRDWATLLPDQVEVVGVQYPGRGMHADAPISDCATMVRRLHAALAPLLDLPFVFFGHSNGALISYELARRLDGAEASRHRHHFVSARGAPQLPRTRRAIGRLERDDFVAAIAELGATPRDILDDRALVDFLMPRLRADFTLGEDYRFTPGPRLPCAASVLYGTEDALADAPQSRPWSELFSGPVRLRTINGGHFYLQSNREAVLELVAGELRALLAPPISSGGAASHAGPLHASPLHH